MLVGKTGFGPSCKQEDINALMVGLAKQGKRVVHLKGGDPLIWPCSGRNRRIKAANIAVDVVPGITAAQGAAARVGIPLTDRKSARRLQYVTGHTKNGAVPSDLDWQSLADPTTTTAVYMPTRTLAAWLRSDSGRPHPQTPALAIARATRPDQAVVAAPIGELPLRVAEAELPGPMLVMVGQVLNPHSAIRRSAKPVGQKAG